MLACALWCVLATAVSHAATVRDEFNGPHPSASYSGTDGTLPWLANWQENGEADGPTTGSIRVESNSRCAAGHCLFVAAVAGPDARRRANLSSMSAATLSFTWGCSGFFGPLMQVEARANATGPWTTVLNLSDGCASGPTTHSANITSVISANTELRFGTDGGAGSGGVYFDNVQIERLPSIAGRVFEDADFVGTASAYNAANDKALQGVDVELYNGTTNAYIASTTTAVDGSYSFGGLSNINYKVRVRSATLGSGGAAPKGGLNGTVPGTWPNPLPEMTWGNGVALYGGQSPTVDDTATGNNGGPGDTYVTVGVSGADVTGVDLGFAYNLIVNTLDDTNSSAQRSVQGGLRQFIKNSNGIAPGGGTTADFSEFRVPITDPNYSPGTGVFTIAPQIQLPDIADAGTALDASTQGDNTVQTNAGSLGAGGKVGVDQLDLSTVSAPEVEIAGDGSLAYGLRFTGSSGVLRGIAIYGFGLSSIGEGNVFVADAITGPLIEQNLIGSGAAAFTDPGPGLRGFENVYSDGADNGTIRNNLIGFGGTRGILISGTSTGWTIEDNELRDNSLDEEFGDGLAIDPGQATVTGNLIFGSASQGVVLKGSTGSTFANNRIEQNGIGTDSTSGNAAGMTFRSTASGHTVDRNQFVENYGAGLSVNDGATGIEITKNSFSLNGTITARNSDPKTDQIGIDLNEPGDDSSAGTSPFYSLNDPIDSGGNNLLNFPILETALINGANLELEGWAPADSVIEVFLRDTEPTLLGEGMTWVFTVTENGTAAGGEDTQTDLDTGPATSYSGTINGVDQGADTENRFRFVFTKPAAISQGSELVATARDGSNNTSEFGGRVTVTASYAIAGTVFEDADFAGTASDFQAGDLALEDVEVELYNAADAHLQTVTTNASGQYGFSVMADGTYKVRARSATIGSGNAAPAGGLNGSVPGTWPDPLPEMTWGNGAAVYGGQDPAVDDTATAATIGPGDTYVTISVSGGDVTGVNLGFAYNLIVNTADDTNADDARSAQGSLRQFLKNANAIGTGGGTTANSSQFRIPGAGPHTIQPVAALPAMDDPLVLDGYTQPGASANTAAAPAAFDGTLLIELDGTTAGASVDGLVVSGGSSTIRGLVINRFLADGIVLKTLGGNAVEGNYIGVDTTGMLDRGNTLQGVDVESIGNTIGGAAPAARNISSGNDSRGVRLKADGNFVYGNYLGVAADGLTERRNNTQGIKIVGGDNNTVGGSTPAEGNLISGNDGIGVLLENAADGNFVRGNLIGTDRTGAAGLDNLTGGIRVAQNSHDNTIGGLLPGQGNTIAFNGGPGIIIRSDCLRNAIQRNSITSNTGLGIDINDNAVPDLNDLGDVVPGGNNVLNYPVLDTAWVVGANLRLAGWARPGSIIELFVSDGDPSDFGEGATHEITLTEGGTGAGGEDSYADTDGATNDPYGGVATPVNGILQGEDSTNRFDFTFPLSAGVVVGTELTATARDGVGNTSEFSGYVTVAVAPADLSITKTDGPDPAPVDGPVVYTLVVTNNGPHTATNVVVTDVLPAGTSFVSATPSQGSCSGTTTITCNLGAIVNTGTASVEILILTPSVVGIITNNASVAADQTDPVGADNSAAENTDVVLTTNIMDLPLTQYTRLHGFLDYTVTGGSLRTGDQGNSACNVGPNSTANLSGIPVGATIRAAYLYWGGSGATVDTNVTLDSQAITADRTFTGQFTQGSKVYDFFSGMADVTAQIDGSRNGSYTFTGLTVDTTNPFCSGKAVIAGWSLFVIYEENSLTGKTLVLYDGFDIERHGATSYILSGIWAAEPVDVRTTFLTWEGDAGLAGGSESLEFNATAQSDVDNPVDNVFNSTINSLGVTDSWGVDLDTFDVSSLVSEGDTLASTRVSVGPDMVILNAVLLQAKSNIIVGHAFEDVNYGGGAGRDMTTAVAAAPSFTVPRPGAVVELYDNAGVFLRTTTTDTDGNYGFAGLNDGDYDVRVVNDSVDSGRPSAAGTEWPVQTYRSDASSGTAAAVSDEVGGADPAAEDSGANATMLSLGSITAQSVAPVTVATGIAVLDVDFGFNFDSVVNTNATGQGTLRQFLDNANSLGNANLDQDGRTAGIEHAIFMLADGTARPGLKASYPSQFSAGVATITPGSALPFVLFPAVLDATTQPGWVDRPIVELDGTGVAAGVSGLQVSAGASTIRGFVINDFTFSGIRLDTAGGNTVQANWLGLDATGTSAAPNSGEGVFIDDVPGNTVGGTDAADRNVLSGNQWHGVLVEGANASGNKIEGNFIGTDPTGMVPIPNDIGVYLNDAPNNVVGGTLVGAGNLVSGNDVFGVYLVGAPTTGNRVEGNTIGLRSDGSGPLGNGGRGVGVFAAVANTIGGTDPDAANVVTGSTVGIGLDSGSALTIRGNAIYGNGSVGIDLDMDGVTPNDGATGAGANDGLDYPIFTESRLAPGVLHIEGYVGTPATKVPGPHTIEVFKADDDGNNNGEIIAGDGESVPHGEGRWLIDSCLSAVDGTFSCVLTVPGTVTLADGDTITAVAIDGTGNTSEFSACYTTASLAIVKRAFQLDGTPIASGSTLPTGMPVRFLLYVSNAGGVVPDVSLQDVLNALFAYTAGSIRYDNSVAACAGSPCSALEEAAIFAAADGGTVGTDAVNGDPVSFSGVTVSIGDETAANAQLDLAAGKVWALVFTVQMQ
ncbi:MAG: DUF11 domain-containing protein [bacterium]|nr:DUF11 domain-containing protein [bacterium]